MVVVDASTSINCITELCFINFITLISFLICSPILFARILALSNIFTAGVFVVYSAEQGGNPILAKRGLQTQATATQPGGNMEGKEVRFGIANTALFTVITTDASCGAINNAH